MCDDLNDTFKRNISVACADARLRDNGLQVHGFWPDIGHLLESAAE
jgi:hypothetical protein